MNARRRGAGHGRQPRKRSPVPPPGFVMGKTSYDRSSARKALQAEVKEFHLHREPPMRKIRIAAGKLSMEAELNDSATADALLRILPIESTAQRWGREVYFKIPMHCEPENAQPKVPSGTVAFWPDGDCLCIFFGQTPYSPVNVVGRLLGDPDEFAQVRDGDTILVENAE